MPDGMRLYAWLLTGSIICCGCGSGNLVPVSGTVQREGKAVTGGTVIFAPIGGGKPAQGIIQPDGAFQLTTAAPNDGAMAGTYHVTVMGERGSENEASSGTYMGPRDKPLEVIAGKNNEFSINISKQDGWQY